MRTVKLLKPYLNFNTDEVILLDNNVAFGLVDSGVATFNLEVVKEKVKVMTPIKRGRGYKVK